MRTFVLATILALVGCASAGTEQSQQTRRIWVEEDARIPSAAPSFAMAGQSKWILQGPLGSWNEPLVVEGTVLSAGRRQAQPLDLRSPGWRASHELAIRAGEERVLLQYDAPVAPAPVEPGEHVRVVAYSMTDGVKMTFGLVVTDANGALRLAGTRVDRPDEAILPPGWSVEPGPPRINGCGRAFLVRGPGGEIVVEPGHTAVASLGEAGARFAVDVVIDRRDLAPCGEDLDQISVVVRAIREAVHEDPDVRTVTATPIGSRDAL